jgi:hypothetical protein
VVIKNILDPEQFERQRDQEDVIRRIASLDHLKPPPQINPPGEKTLPKQGAAEFPDVTQGTVSLARRGVPVNMDSLKTLVPLEVARSLWAQHSNCVSVVVKGAGLLPHARIEGDGEVFNNNQDFSFHD